MLLPLQLVFAQTKSPAEFLGYELGERFTPHHQIIAYFEHVAANNDNVELERYGETYELRPLVLAFVSSKSNMDNREQIRQDNLKRIGMLEGNPTGKKVAINWLSYNVHGNEAVSSEATMMTLWELVNPSNQATKKWLENSLVIIDPCMNPDGRDRYSNWYNQKKNKRMQPDRQSVEHNEPWPGGRPNHYLFDLNRDWAWQTQQESQFRLLKYNEWMPHLHTDFHEQGIDSPYYFPPAAEPLHKQLSAFQHEFQDLVGRNIAKYFDQESWFYFTKERFDILYPSYGDSWPMYNGAIGMTIEQGGSGRAGIGVYTAEGDTLTLKDRILHHHTTGLAIVEVTSDHAEKVVDEFQKYFNSNRQNPTGKYKSFVIKGDQNQEKLAELLNLLDKNGIQYGMGPNRSGLRGYEYQTGKSASFAVSDKDIVINAFQPKSVLTQVLFEPNPELADSITYDITSWALPYAYGLQAYALESRLDAGRAYEKTAFNSNQVSGKPLAYIAPWSATVHAKFLAALLNEGIKVRYAAYPFEIQGKSYARGSLLITRRGNEYKADFDKTVVDLANQHQIALSTSNTGYVDKGKDFGSGDVHLITAPKVALIGGTGVSSLNFGELWHFFEQELDYPLSILENDLMGRYDLSKYDVLIMPSGNYSGLGDAGTQMLKDFVSKGGKVIAIDGALNFFANKEGFDLRTYDSEDEKKEIEKVQAAIEREERIADQQESERLNISNFAAGAIFEVKMDPTYPLSYGMDGRFYTLKNNGNRFAYLNKGVNAGIIPSNEAYRTGFIGYKVKSKMPESLAFGVEPQGRGHIIYMVDNPSFRNFWQNGKLILANAIFLVGK